MQPAEYTAAARLSRAATSRRPRAGARATGRATWYAQHGRPWVYARAGGRGSTIGRRRDRHRRRVVHQRAAVGDARAGGARRRRARRRQRRARRSKRRRSALWRDEKPDEYFFLEVLRLGGRRASGDDDRRAPVRVGGRRRAWRCCRTTVPGIPSGTSPSSRAARADRRRRELPRRRSRCWIPACCGRRSRCSRSSA